MTGKAEDASATAGWLRWRKTHAIEPGTPCAACATELRGPYCYACGQLAENFHRSVWHLLVEAFESFFHFDGRLAHTAPRLILKPAALTREYLDGVRAFQVPPLRLFLVVLLIFFFAGSFGADERRAEMAKVLARSGAPTVLVVQGAGAGLPALKTSDWPKSLRDTFVTRGLEKALRNPAQFRMIVQEQMHSWAVLMLPVAALILSLLFVFQRRFYVFDHVIFAMHSLSFQGLLLSLALLVSNVSTAGARVMLLIAPVHLFVHMRGTYGISVIGTLIRMLLLFVLSVIGFGALLIGLSLVSLWTMNGH
ncbi:MAG: DUF3667 domain-containing protein [Proteobacteria bacterium]|nr:DUF3667 domain-containing protein [Pseudomonadota bacterium]